MKRILLSFLTLLFAHAVMAQCNPNFTSAMAPVNNNLLNVNFTNTTVYSGPSNTSVYYNMKFGDGAQSNIWSTISHNYASPGTYNVIMYMYVIDSFTQTPICTDSINHMVTVAYTPCASTFSQTTTGNGSFTFTAINPAATSGMTYTWNYGDGNTGTGSPSTHVYTTNGIYTVTLVASSASASCSYTNSHSVPVTNVNSTNCAGHNASFTKSTSGATVYVNNTSPNFSGQTRTTSWNFGDGGTSTSTSTSHTYASTGTYVITMTCNWVDTFNTSIVYCSSTTTQTVTITTIPPPTNMITGHIIIDSLLWNGLDSFKVWLITFNPSTNMLTAVDSTLAVGYGGANYYFQGAAAGTYLTKAQFINAANSTTSGYIPTYHTSSVYWSGATNIVHTGGNTSGKHINMIQGTPTSGPGFVGGNVNMGANKGTGAGVPNLLVMLRDANGNPIQMTYTNAAGDYSFSNIPLGTYSIYPEEMNYVTTPFTGVTLTSAAPSAIGFIFGVDNDQIKPKTTSVSNVPGADQFNIYPNPSTGQVFINWAVTPAEYNVIVTDIAGHVVFKAANQSKMDLSQLQSGMYFIKLSTGNMNVTEKLMIKH